MITIVFLHGDKCSHMAISVRIWRYVFLHGDYMFLHGDKCTYMAISVQLNGEFLHEIIILSYRPNHWTIQSLTNYTVDSFVTIITGERKV